MYRVFHHRRRRLLRISFVAALVWFYFCLPAGWSDKPLSVVLFDRDGKLLAAQIATDGQWRFAPGDSLPQKFVTALKRFEDRNFDDHHGVYLPSLARAALQNLKAKRVVSGGSTLSMQVIRLSRDNPKRSFTEKLTEMARAIRLETRYSKDEILHFYCTHAPMGGNVVGVEAAAWRYFNRSPHELTWAEAATLAVLPNAPGLIHPGKNRERLKEKRDRLLDALHLDGHFDALTLSLSKGEALPHQPADLNQRALHLMHRMKREHPLNFRFNSTLTDALQRQTEAIVNEHSKRLSANLVHNCAALIADAQTGEVLAYVGNSKAGEHGSHVDMITAPRSPGSSLKPFLYCAMLDEAMMTPNQWVSDVPLTLSGFRPQNFSSSFAGVVPASEALARSLNIPAVKQLKRYGVAAFQQKLHDLGFRQLHQSASHYGLSLILGGGEVTLWELASGWYHFTATLHHYQTFNGQYTKHVTPLRADAGSTPPQLQLSATPAVFSAGSVYATLAALEGVKRPDDLGEWEQLGSARRIAWKTGTSYGYRDAWATGVSDRYIVCVWVGNADGTGRPGVIGSRAAAPLLFDLFDGLPSDGFFTPPYDDLIEVEVCAQTGAKAGPHCSHRKLQAIPRNAHNAPICAHHQPIFLSADQRFRGNIDCLRGGALHSWLVLDPLEAFYFKRSNPLYTPLPPVHPDCQSADERAQMAIVYPAEGSTLTAARDLDGTWQPIVFEAVHTEPIVTLHWHLNERYLGTTRNLHQLEFIPENTGEQHLRIVSEDGTTVVRHFHFIGKP
jgi:penicillin-binding protein 1C